MRGDLFSEFDGSCLFGYLFIPLFCGTRTSKEGKKKHMSTFQIYACNYLNSFTHRVNIDSEITRRINTRITREFTCIPSKDYI